MFHDCVFFAVEINDGWSDGQKLFCKTGICKRRCSLAAEGAGGAGNSGWEVVKAFDGLFPADSKILNNFDALDSKGGDKQLIDENDRLLPFNVHIACDCEIGCNYSHEFTVNWQFLFDVVETRIDVDVRRVEAEQGACAVSYVPCVPFLVCHDVLWLALQKPIGFENGETVAL